MSPAAKGSAVTTRFIRGIPKCELHVHIEGCLEPELMFALAARNRVRLRYRNVEDVRKAYRFRNLQSFLDLYYEGANVLLRQEDFFDLTRSYFKKAAEQNVRHAEIFFDPQTHMERGVPFEAILHGISDACEEAARDFRVSGHLILCFLRHLSADSAMETLRKALPYRDKIIGVGLDSSEKGHPASKFQEVFAAARRNGFLAVAHAGEEGPPEYVWDALKKLKVRRIDHGVRSLEDPRLVRDLAARQVPLTVCPLSNIRLRIFPHMKNHPLRKMLRKGLRVTVNSDDPAYFGGYVNENFLAAHRALHLTRAEVVRLVQNSFEASFLPKSRKTAHLAEIDAFVRKI